MADLRGVGVLVTRPQHQAEPLCRLLESAGAATIRLPALEIRQTAGAFALSSALGPIEAFDLVIFTSANAVSFGAFLLDGTAELQLAAIGHATARALRDAGHRVHIVPSAGSDSDSLLEHPALAHCAGRRVLIVKGMHGRELLQRQLALRGAVVQLAEVYKRIPARADACVLGAVEAGFAAGRIHLVTATSAEIATGLLDMVTASLREWLNRVPWLVPSARVAAVLRERGTSAPIVLARSAEDQDLLEAAARWRSSASGA